MGTRPYYAIIYERDGDGYESALMYVGCNKKAAIARYAFLFNKLKRTEFLDHGITEDDMEIRYGNIPDDTPIGYTGYSSMNDQDCYYVTLHFRVIALNSFVNQREEAEFKLNNPNTKY